VSPTHVTIRLDQPGQLPLEYEASQETAANKLLRATQFELPASGRWNLEVEMDGPHGPIVVNCEIDATEPMPRWREMWPWFTWPALVIVLFSINQGLRRGVK